MSDLAPEPDGRAIHYAVHDLCNAAFIIKANLELLCGTDMPGASPTIGRALQAALQGVERMDGVIDALTRIARRAG